MRSLVVLIPGDLSSRTGGYGYDRRIVAGLRALGWSVLVHSIGERFPSPTHGEREDVARLLASLPIGAMVLIDGLACGAMAEEAERECARLRLVALVHHPLAAETGLDPDLARQLETSERRALAATRFVVVTSSRTASAIERYGVPRTRIAVIEPGTDRRPLAEGSGGGVCQLLCVASVVPRKGHEILIEALSSLRSLAWRLSCVGSLDRHRATVDRLRKEIEASRLGDRIVLEGELDEDAVARSYEHADLFVLPTFYEGYGMAVAEALAHGVPVVSTATGDIPSLLADEAGLLVPVGDATALRDALHTVMTDTSIRERLRAGARRTRDRLPSWEDAARKMAHALDEVAASG